MISGRDASSTSLFTYKKTFERVDKAEFGGSPTSDKVINKLLTTLSQWYTGRIDFLRRLDRFFLLHTCSSTFLNPTAFSSIFINQGSASYAFNIKCTLITYILQIQWRYMLYHLCPSKRYLIWACSVQSLFSPTLGHVKWWIKSYIHIPL